MMLNIKLDCDFCENSMEYVYTPIGSKRGMEVFACGECGLLASKSFKNYISRPPGNMSSDADRSSFRYTKTLVADSYSELLLKYIGKLNIEKILDVGFNRGAFFRWACENLEFKKVTGIETDASVTGVYNDDSRVDLIINRIENIKLKNKEYDFSFCAHTLEHALSAKDMLQQIFNSLKIGGRLFLAVPNLIWHKDVIEEFFIDPHTFHFNYYVLKAFIERTGFKIIYKGNPCAADVIFILEKNKENFILRGKDTSSDRLANIKDSIKEYNSLITANRKLIKKTVSSITSHCNEGGKYFIWGAGRIFDALVKFGKLEPCKNLYLIDKYLYAIFKNINGFNVYMPEQIRKYVDVKSVVYVASRDYRDEILKEAKSLGISKSLVFGSNLNIMDM